MNQVHAPFELLLLFLFAFTAFFGLIFFVVQNTRRKLALTTLVAYEGWLRPWALWLDKRLKSSTAFLSSQLLKVHLEERFAGKQY